MNMKVICIDDKTLSGNPNRGLTFGKEYEVVKNHGKVFMIIDDYGERTWFISQIFTTIEEWREMKLKEIGI